MGHDQDLGSYTSIGVWSEFDPEFAYINACEEALDIFNSAVDWETLKDHAADSHGWEESDEDEYDDEDEIDEAEKEIEDAH